MSLQPIEEADMRKAITMALPLLFVAAVVGAAEKTRKVSVRWNIVPALGVETANALRIELTDANGDAAAGRIVVRSADPTLRLYQASNSPTDRVTIDVDPSGEVLVGIKRDRDQPVSVTAYAVDVDNNDAIISSIVRIGNPFDSRDSTNITGYTGIVFDTFASSAITKVFDSNNKNDVKERGVFGLDFEHRLMRAKGHQLWIYGETVHGTRSAEQTCVATPSGGTTQSGGTSDACTQQKPPNQDSGNFVALLRAATSIEAFVGLRYEPPLSILQENSSTLFLKTEIGFMKVAGLSDSIIKENHLGIGVMITDGRFRESYFEVGHGRTDLFQEHPGNRWKVDAYLVIDPAIPSGDESFVAPFAQMTVDAHGGHGKGADAVQIYTGVNIALDKLKIGVTK